MLPASCFEAGDFEDGANVANAGTVGRYLLKGCVSVYHSAGTYLVLC